MPLYFKGGFIDISGVHEAKQIVAFFFLRPTFHFPLWYYFPHENEALILLISLVVDRRIYHFINCQMHTIFLIAIIWSLQLTVFVMKNFPAPNRYRHGGLRGGDFSRLADIPLRIEGNSSFNPNPGMEYQTEAQIQARKAYDIALAEIEKENKKHQGEPNLIECKLCMNGIVGDTYLAASTKYSEKTNTGELSSQHFDDMHAVCVDMLRTIDKRCPICRRNIVKASTS